ncbi:hypothetical protein KBC40_02560 [Patescibacteria group bacterium]|nr:hypothetical protein [Patescibacteria group bacterium]
MPKLRELLARRYDIRTSLYDLEGVDVPMRPVNFTYSRSEELRDQDTLEFDDFPDGYDPEELRKTFLPRRRG